MSSEAAPELQPVNQQGHDGRAELADHPLIERLGLEELESIRSEVAAGRRDRVLKTLDERGRAQELAPQPYTGRYPVRAAAERQ